MWENIDEVPKNENMKLRNIDASAPQLIAGCSLKKLEM